MKKTFILICTLFFYLAGQTQVSKTIFLSSVGTLSTLLSSTEKNTITNLTITGVIDARDVKCMRDEIINLSVLDISAVSILAYTGADGTYPGTISYPENEMPLSSFLLQPNTPKLSLTSINLPNSLKSISSYAFALCTNLGPQITIPASVTDIWNYTFFNCTGISKIKVLALTPPNATSASFLNINKSSCTLEVPTGSKSTYQNTVNWSGFGYYIEKSITTQISKTVSSNNNYIFYTTQTQLNITGTSSAEYVFIYNINGNLLKTLKAADGLTVIPLKKGVAYIVKIGEKTEKIIL